MEQGEDNMQEVVDQENVEHQQVEAEQEGVLFSKHKVTPG